MFEYFVTFTEVIKLSQNIFHQLRKVNYHKGISTRNINVVEQIIDLVDIEIESFRFISYFIRREIKHGERWLDIIFKIICIDKTKFYLLDVWEMIITRSCKYNRLNIIKYIIENITSDRNYHILEEAINYNRLEIVNYVLEKDRSRIHYFLNEVIYDGKTEVIKLMTNNSNDIFKCRIFNMIWLITKFMFGK